MPEIKVLHVLYESLPTISGSTIRTKDILESQVNSSTIYPVVLTSPFQKSNSKMVVINGVKHYRFPSNIKETASENIRKNPIILLNKLVRIFSFTLQIIKISKIEKVDVIHAHAMFFCAISSKIAGLYLRKPVVYEVRSLWEERGKTSRPLLTKIFIWLENLSLKISNEVICINENLRNELISRSKLKKEIHIVPNAVNFYQIKHNSVDLREELTFGYIGTLSPIEGLDLLLETLFELKNEGIVVKLKLFGKGVFEDKLAGIIHELNLTNVKMMGEVNPMEIYKAYEEVDVIINPRKKSKLSDMVTPLKPLEALGYRKLLLISDVGGMKQLVTKENIAFSFIADNKESLKKEINRILKSSEKDRISRIDNGFRFVYENKNWESNVEKYLSIYEHCISKY